MDPKDLDEAANTIPKKSDTEARLGQLVIDDPLPAGLEPVESAFVTTAQALTEATHRHVSLSDTVVPKTSRYGHSQSLYGVHREMRDDRVLFFLSHIEPGIFHFRYLARATTPGVFVVPPTRGSAMYDPEVFGQNRSSTWKVAPRR